MVLIGNYVGTWRDSARVGTHDGSPAAVINEIVRLGLTFFWRVPKTLWQVLSESCDRQVDCGGM